MDKGPCPHCVEIDCYVHCYETAEGKHEADPKSASSGPQDGDANIVVDFNCKHCGQSGGLAVDPKNIQWD